MKQEIIKGIVIDPNTQTVEEVQVQNNLEGYYELLGCDLIDRVAVDDYNDLIVDDEGLYKSPEVFFSIDGVEGYYVGKSVIVGVNEREGEWTDTSVDINQLHVHFYKRLVVKEEN